jgi:hypothetical protein
MLMSLRITGGHLYEGTLAAKAIVLHDFAAVGLSKLSFFDRLESRFW